jgi:hypothetical protein
MSTLGTNMRVAACSVFFNIYNYNYQVEEDEAGEACRANGEKGTAYRLLVGKSEGNNH